MKTARKPKSKPVAAQLREWRAFLAPSRRNRKRCFVVVLPSNIARPTDSHRAQFNGRTMWMSMDDLRADLALSRLSVDERGFLSAL